MKIQTVIEILYELKKLGYKEAIIKMDVVVENKCKKCGALCPPKHLDRGA
jgi:hypothetical protein